MLLYWLAAGLVAGGILGFVFGAGRAEIWKRYVEDRVWRIRRGDTYSVITDVNMYIREPKGRKELGLPGYFFAAVAAGHKLVIRPDPLGVNWCDAWGRLLLIKRKREPEILKNGTVWVDVVIWSVGPNGLDEEGSGDDICLLDAYVEGSLEESGLKIPNEGKKPGQ